MQNLLLGLAALACPIGMGLMMLLMGRGRRSGGVAPEGDAGAQHEVAGLRAEVEQLRTEQHGTPRVLRG